MSKIKVKSFEDAINEHENGGEKAAKREAQKRAKYNQIKTQKGDLEDKIYNQNQKLEKSYFDPSIDTVKAYMDLQVLEKEQAACEEIMKGLFPNGLTKPAEATTA